MNAHICLYGEIFHQVFWTLFSFLLFYYSFYYFFCYPIIGALKLRLSEENLLKNLIEKKKSDKAFFDTRKIELKQSRKAKIDSYVVKNLSKNEKEWAEAIFSLKVEMKSLSCCNSCDHKNLDNQIICQIFDKVVLKYGC